MIPGSGRSPGEGNGNPLQYSFLENSVGYNPWGCKESDTSERLHFHFSFGLYRCLYYSIYIYTNTHTLTHVQYYSPNYHVNLEQVQFLLFFSSSAYLLNELLCNNYPEKCCAVLCLVAQSCLTLACQASLSMGILQARILEWVAMPFFREPSRPRD